MTTPAAELRPSSGTEPTSAPPPRRPWLAFFDVLTAVLLVGGIWLALPARWWPVDVVGTLLALAFAASGVGLAIGAQWAVRVARATAAVSLVLGLALATTLALTAAYLSGLYGAVGSGGALLLTAVAALVLPYLVALPAAQLALLRSS